jgi:hypothetical protein
MCIGVGTMTTGLGHVGANEEDVDAIATDFLALINVIVDHLEPHSY